MIKLTKNQRGDTIVEVLIALTVVGTMLTGAYASARRSMFTVVASQERLEALKLAEGQLERLKYKINNADTPSPLTQSAPFCIENTSANSIVTSLPKSDCAQGVDSRYIIQISRVMTGSPPEYTFTVTASWDHIGGGGSDSLTLSYKVN